MKTTTHNAGSLPRLVRPCHVNWLRLDMLEERPGKRRDIAAWRDARLRRLIWAVNSGRATQRKLLRMHQLEYDATNAGWPNSVLIQNSEAKDKPADR